LRRGIESCACRRPSRSGTRGGCRVHICSHHYNRAETARRAALALARPYRQHPRLRNGGKAGNQDEAKKAADDVVANAKQIADAVAGFYGKPAGEQMLKLLAGHWGGVKALTDAEHSGDKSAHQKAMQDLAQNATAIAKFLASANPNLPEATVQGLLMMHVADHETQIDQIMAGNTAGEAQTWTHMQAHMNTIADALADAIAKQFPSKAS
jgi:hypothetical protein